MPRSYLLKKNNLKIKMQIWRNDALWNKLNEKKKFVEFSLEIVEIKTKILKIAR